MILGPHTMEILVAVLGALLAISEALAFIPGVKANGIFQAIFNGLKKIKDMVSKKPE